MITKWRFAYTLELSCTLFLLLSACSDRYRYFCQDPDNFSAAQCQKPRCEFDQTCPEYLVAPILEKKIEGTIAQVPGNTASQGTPNCR
jgi:hypothetical protein